jgi:hypothetical protein
MITVNDAATRINSHQKIEFRIFQTDKRVLVRSISSEYVLLGVAFDLQSSSCAITFNDRTYQVQDRAIHIALRPDEVSLTAIYTFTFRSSSEIRIRSVTPYTMQVAELCLEGSPLERPINTHWFRDAESLSDFTLIPESENQLSQVLALLSTSASGLDVSQSPDLFRELVQGIYRNRQYSDYFREIVLKSISTCETAVDIWADVIRQLAPEKESLHPSVIELIQRDIALLPSSLRSDLLALYGTELIPPAQLLVCAFLP